MAQANLLENMIKFNNKSRQRSKEDRDKKRNTFDSVIALGEGQELTFNAFRSRILPIKEAKGKGRPSMLALCPLDLATELKILAPKQCFKDYQ